MKKLSKLIIEYDELKTYYDNNKDIIWHKAADIDTRHMCRFYIMENKIFGKLLHIDTFNQVLYIVRENEIDGITYIDKNKKFKIYGIKFVKFERYNSDVYDIIYLKV